MGDHIRTQPLGSGGDYENVAADELATLNGTSVADEDVKAERVKPIFGDSGDGRDVSTAHPLPTTDASVLAAVDGLETLLGTSNTSLASILAKLLVAPATEAKQDAANTLLAHLTDGTQQVTVPAQAAWSRRAATNGNSFAATVLRGFALRETAGAAAVVNIYAGTNNSGTLLVSVSLSALESARDSFGPTGIGQSGSGTAITNLFVEVASGTVTGSVFV
jgi:hypothetical protein